MKLIFHINSLQYSDKLNVIDDISIYNIVTFSKTL